MDRADRYFNVSLFSSMRGLSSMLTLVCATAGRPGGRASRYPEATGDVRSTERRGDGGGAADGGRSEKEIRRKVRFPRSVACCQH